MGLKYRAVGPMIVDDQTGVLLGYRDGHGVDRYLDGRVMQGDEHGDGPPVGGLILTTQNGLALVTIQGEQFAMLPVDANGDVIANIGQQTGLLGDLMALAGNPGQIGVATDMTALVLFNGTAGQAKSSRSWTTTQPLAH